MQGLSKEDAAKQFWMTDVSGLLTKARKQDDLSETARRFERSASDDPEGEKLADTVKRVSHQLLSRCRVGSRCS